VLFSGLAKAENNLLSSFTQEFDSDFDNNAVTRKILSEDADAFEMQLYENRKLQLEFYKNYPGADSFDPWFKNYIENTIRYNYFARLLSYPIIRANQSTTILSVKAL